MSKILTVNCPHCAGQQVVDITERKTDYKVDCSCGRYFVIVFWNGLIHILKIFED